MAGRTGVGSAAEANADAPADPAAEQLEVLVLPDYTDVNPYQRRLADGLAERGVSVTTAEKGRWLPVLEVVRAEGRPDVLHVHFFHQMMIASKFTPPLRGVLSVLLSARLVVELLVLRAAGVTVVWTAHDLLNHERHAVRTERLFKHVIVRALCDGVVVHCERATDTLVDTFALPERVREKVTVIPHGHFVDDYPNEVSRTAARAHLEVGQEETVYLFFGWIRRYKNVPLLIETFAELDAEAATLLVAGNPRTEALERAVREAARGVDGVRTRLEFVPDEEVQYYMNAADAVVLPFRTGRQTLLTSGSALLAMSFGRALIAPRLGCIGDVLDEDGGFCYAESDRAALRTAMREALEADLASMGEHNYRTVRQFEWGPIVDRTLAVYLRLADGAGR
jgi:glycosyltransferase involved in cell wall biosynthesis